MLGQGLGLCIRASLLTAACRLVDHLHHDKYSYQLPVLAASFIVVKTFPLLAYRLVGFQCQKDFRGRAINSQQGGGRDSGSHAAGCWLLQVLAVSRGVRMALTAAFTCSQEQVTRRPRLSRLVAFVLEVVPRSATHGQKDQSRLFACGIVLRHFTGRTHCGSLEFVPELSCFLRPCPSRAFRILRWRILALQLSSAADIKKGVHAHVCQLVGLQAIWSQTIRGHGLSSVLSFEPERFDRQIQKTRPDDSGTSCSDAGRNNTPGP